MTTVDLTDPVAFKGEYPEFALADDTLVRAKLSDGIDLCDSDTWGNLLKQGVYLYAAHRLAISPFAREMKLVNANGSTSYDDDLTMLKRMVSSGNRVVTY